MEEWVVWILDKYLVSIMFWQIVDIAIDIVVKRMVGLVFKKNCSNLSFGVGGQSWYQVDTKSIIVKYNSCTSAVVGIIVDPFDNLD